MQFLKTLFWVALAIILVLFASVNWNPVTIRLWGGLEADVKLPVLVLATFLLGFLPTFILYRARLWTMRRRVEAHERQAAAVHSVPTGPGPSPASDIVEAPPQPEDRIATDSKAWPA
jgi:uncharacterized integral membrane protein